MWTLSSQVEKEVMFKWCVLWAAFISHYFSEYLYFWESCEILFTRPPSLIQPKSSLLGVYLKILPKPFLYIHKSCWFTTYLCLVKQLMMWPNDILEIVVCFWTFLPVNQCLTIWGISILFFPLSLKIWPTKLANYKKDLSSPWLIP